MPIYLWALVHARVYKLTEHQTNWRLLQSKFFIAPCTHTFIKFMRVAVFQRFLRAIEMLVLLHVILLHCCTLT